MLSSFLHSRTTSISKNPVYPQPTRGEFNSDKINGITEKRKAFESSLPIYTVSLRSIPRKFSHRGGRSRFNCKLERKILKRPLPPTPSPLPRRQKSISVAARGRSSGNDDTVKGLIINHPRLYSRRIIFRRFYRKIQWTLDNGRKLWMIRKNVWNKCCAIPDVSYRYLFSLATIWENTGESRKSRLYFRMGITFLYFIFV